MSTKSRLRRIEEAADERVRQEIDNVNSWFKDYRSMIAKYGLETVLLHQEVAAICAIGEKELEDAENNLAFVEALIQGTDKRLERQRAAEHFSETTPNP